MKKKYIKHNKVKNLNYIFWVGLLLITLFQFFYFGITYFNYLDDYNTYGIFNRRNKDIWHNIILWYKLYTFRPIAFFCDSYITQWFWGKMWLVLFFYIILHFINVFLFYKIIYKLNIKFGAFGVIITAITPLLFEAVYWVAASTRLVSGMFFSISSLYFLLIYIERKNIPLNNLYLFLYVFFNIISVGFYEQVVVFNLVFSLIVIYIKNKDITKNFKLILFTPIVGTFLITIFYIVLAPYGKVKVRGQLATNLLLQLKKVTIYIFNILLKVNLEINIKGFFSGIKLITSKLQMLILLFVIIYTLVTFLLLLNNKILQNNNVKFNNKFNIMLGIILIFVPFAPFYILKQPYICERAVYPSIFGISLFLDTIFNIKYKNKFKFLYPLLSTIFIVPFFIVNISRVNDTKLIEQIDNKIIENLLEKFEKTKKDDKTTIILFNTKKLYSNVFNKRLENITSSDWALLGKANATSKNFYFKNIIPIENKEIIHNKYLNKNYIFFGIDNKLNIYNLKLKENKLIIKENNIIFGYLNKNNENNFKFNFIY